MRKAKEYFEEMKVAFDSKDEKTINAAVVKVFNEMFMEEVEELRESRGSSSDSAMRAIFKQQNQKWNSLCDKCESIDWPVLKKDAIKDYIEEKVLHGGKL